MDVMSYSHFRKELASTLERVVADRSPILITRQNAEPTVIMSLKDFQAYEETAYLMASPKNAERLREALAQAKAGQVQAHELIES
ncbi:type II toxin-antitoxin system Phd/YefM family antitoxin [Moraxella sp. ZY210820]|uniref:type II toxin-antitoxin system Phd/YefM family antitoxin n=1 Tax=unclassified Moraxella TaxID=2685852 RepID=UPI002730B325|nr:type II toxin-antitoxin system prevent-host-death family antitoxin [Moraxella sp. ZY210820]WLF82919.1 type II toxin-antitoxin system prevent-host-death family antitoxin [Moraxella sp. ZY210820]